MQEEKANNNGTKKTFTYPASAGQGPNSTAIEYSYDANNQITGVNIPNAGFVSFSTYKWTRPTSITLPGGGKREFNYDALMRTQAITSKDPGQNQIMGYNYAYDKMDNIKTRNTGAGNYAYNYDDLYRLNDVKKDTQSTEAYTYDPVGNRKTSNTSTDWTYNANNELLSYTATTPSPANAGYQYDANGNTTQKNSNGQIVNYIYNADNRLVEVKDGSNNTIAKYTYDPFGRRIKKTVSPAGGGQGVETYYLYSDEGLIGEYDATGTEIKTYGYKPNSTWSTDPIFCHSREGGNPEFYFYHNDHLGTPQKMTNISGAVVWSATYDAFGKATVDGASTITNNLRFPGQYFDAETGLHYNRARYYDPKAGRFVTKDPIGFDGGINVYAYVGNNPVNYTDPMGLDNPGCDIPSWAKAKVEANDCFLRCCAKHDNCYKENDCSCFSWGGTVAGGPLARLSKCVRCNDDALGCFATCTTRFKDKVTSPGKYYCARCGVWFDDPASPHMKHTTDK